MIECQEYKKFLQISEIYTDPQKCAESCLETLPHTRYIISTTEFECHCSTTRPAQHCVFETAQVYKLRSMCEIVNQFLFFLLNN